MELFVTIIHVTVCTFMILVILLQQGKSGMGAIGGGVGGANFGTSSQPNILSKMTVGASIIFMVTSMTLAWLSTRDTSVVADEPEIEETAGGAADGEEEAAAEGDEKDEEDLTTADRQEAEGEAAEAEAEAGDGEAGDAEAAPEEEAAPTEEAPPADDDAAPAEDAAPAKEAAAPEGETTE